MQNIQTRSQSEFMQQFSDFKNEIFTEFRSILKEEINIALSQQKEFYERKICKLEERINDLENGLEEIEQYQRRLCIRIDGVPTTANETADEVFKNTEKLIQEACPDILSSQIDRAHRIGPEYQCFKTKRKCRSIIVRFATFKARTTVYRKRREMKDVKIKLDLTKKRYALFTKCVKDANDVNNNVVDYVYSDINCRLKVVLRNKSEKFFSSFDEYQEIVRMA